MLGVARKALAGATRAASPCNAGSGALPALLSQLRGKSKKANGDEIEVEVSPFETYKMDAPSTTVKVSKSSLKEWYRTMSEIRRMEIALDVAYKSQLIRGFCHLSDGQEAIAMGIAAGLSKGDSIITAYRDHGHHVVHGGTVREVVGELFGKECGASKGLGGSMHMYSKEHNWYGGCGIVGAPAPLGVGLALRHKYLDDGHVSFTLYGDGASNQGQVFEAFNLAGIWDLPVVFVIENNHYGMGTSVARATRAPALYKRGDFLPGFRVDGMDVVAVKQATEYAKSYALQHGPLLVEMETYRYHGHSMSDPGSSYRTRDEVQEVRRKRDPLAHLKSVMLEHGAATEDEIKAIDKEAKKTVSDVVESCKQEREPGVKEYMAKYAYVNPSPFGRGARGVTIDKEWKYATG